MSGGDESTGGIKNATLEIDLVERMMVKPDPVQGGTANDILGQAETMSAPGAGNVIMKREANDMKEGMKAIGYPEEMRGAATKEELRRKSNEANETLIRDNEMTIGGQENLESQANSNYSSRNDISSYKRRAENSYL